MSAFRHIAFLAILACGLAAAACGDLRRDPPTSVAQSRGDVVWIDTDGA